MESLENFVNLIRGNDILRYAAFGMIYTALFVGTYLFMKEPKKDRTKYQRPYDR